MVSNDSLFRTYSTHPGCRIIVDSCSDITAELAREIGVDVLEFPFVMGDGEHYDDQYESMTPEQFFGRMLDGERVLTSAISTGRFIELFEGCVADGIPTVYLSFTAGLSSSVYDAEEAARIVLQKNPGFGLYVVDNRLPALSATLLAFEAAELRDAGWDAGRIARWAGEEAYRHIHGYFTLQSLDWVAAGGRIPRAAVTLSAVLDTKANLSYDLDGSLKMTGVSRGRKKALKALVVQLEENYELGSRRPIAIVDAAAPADADLVERMVRKVLGDSCPRILRLPLDPTIGAHVGPGMVALSFWGKDRCGSSESAGTAR